MRLVNFTSGTRSNADYTENDATNFVPSQATFSSILRRDREDPHGLSGFLLLLHIGNHPKRTDKSPTISASCWANSPSGAMVSSESTNCSNRAAVDTSLPSGEPPLSAESNRRRVLKIPATPLGFDDCSMLRCVGSHHFHPGIHRLPASPRLRLHVPSRFLRGSAFSESGRRGLRSEDVLPTATRIPTASRRRRRPLRGALFALYFLARVLRCAAFSMLAILGCRQVSADELDRRAVSGKVTLDGAPLASGMISFDPMEGLPLRPR